MNPAPSILPSADPVTKHIFGRIGLPIHHQDESQSINGARLLQRLAQIRGEIERRESEYHVMWVKAAYYEPCKVLRRKSLASLSNLERALGELSKQYSHAYRAFLAHQKKHPEETTGYVAANPAGLPLRREELRRYEPFWVARLLRMAAGRDFITPDDLRIALPERVFTERSLLRVLEVLDYIGVDLLVDDQDAFPTAQCLIAAALDEAEDIAEASAAAIRELSTAQNQLVQTVVHLPEAISPTLRLLIAIRDREVRFTDVSFKESIGPHHSFWKTVDKLIRSLSWLGHGAHFQRNSKASTSRMHPAAHKALQEVFCQMQFKFSAVESIARSMVDQSSKGSVEPGEGQGLIRALENLERLEEQVIERHLHYAVVACPAFLGRGLELEDLVQEACTGLRTALDYYDPRRAVAFRSYASFWIGQSLKRAVALKGRQIRLPVHVHDRIAKLTSRVNEQELEDPEDYAVLVDSEDIRNDLELAASQMVPLQQVSEVELHAAAKAELLDHHVCYEEDDVRTIEDIVRQALATLDDRETDVISRRYGLNRMKVQTLEEIGAIYGLTRERIRQIERNALMRLRHPCRSELLRSL